LGVRFFILFQALQSLFFGSPLEESLEAWHQLDQDLQAHLASNGVACRASALQGAGLLRVGRQWQTCGRWPKKGHHATAFGLLAARWDVEGMRNLMKFGKSGIQRRLKAEGKPMYVTQEAVSGDISYIRNENPCSIPCVRTVARLQGFSSRVPFKSSLQEFSSRVLFFFE